MIPQTKPRKRRNSSRVNLLISLTVHTAIVLALFYFAAREGLLGKELKKIAVQMVKEKPPEKPKEPEPQPEPPREETPIQEAPTIADAPPVEASRETVQGPPPAGLPRIAPPAAQIPSFAFEGGKAVQSSSDPAQVYKGLVEYALRSKWNRPVDVEDHSLVAEVEISVDREGKISHPDWKKSSGHARWDDSVRQAIAVTRAVNRPPPTNFPSRILVRFDVQEIPDESLR